MCSGLEFYFTKPLFKREKKKILCPFRIPPVHCLYEIKRLTLNSGARLKAVQSSSSRITARVRSQVSSTAALLFLNS